MNYYKILCLGILSLSLGQVIAETPYEYKDIKDLYLGGAAGMRAQCPFCNNYYYVGAVHRCPKSN